MVNRYLFYLDSVFGRYDGKFRDVGSNKMIGNAVNPDCFFCLSKDFIAFLIRLTSHAMFPG